MFQTDVAGNVSDFKTGSGQRMSEVCPSLQLFGDDAPGSVPVGTLWRLELSFVPIICCLAEISKHLWRCHRSPVISLGDIE